MLLQDLFLGAIGCYYCWIHGNTGCIQAVSEESELDRRQWHFDNELRTILDSPDHRHLLQ